MAAFFLDTSALVNRYIQETGTSWLQALASPAAGHALFLVRIAHVEAVAAVTRRERSGTLTSAHAQTSLDSFLVDLASQYFVIDVSQPLVSHAAGLARMHGLRGYDAVHLAAALEIAVQAPGLTLLSADRELNAAASAEGLAVDDPNSHP